LSVRAPWPRDLPALTCRQLLTPPTALNQRGFAGGKPYGILGPAKRGGHGRRYQRGVGISANGRVSALAGANSQAGCG
jgi:hypothetical protein